MQLRLRPRSLWKPRWDRARDLGSEKSNACLFAKTDVNVLARRAVYYDGPGFKTWREVIRC